MKCPKCGYHTFDYAESCKRCGRTLNVKPRYKTIYEHALESGKQKTARQQKEETIDDSAQPSLFTSPSYETLFAEPTESPEQEEILDLDLAGFASRATAFLIDLVILFGITTVTLAAGLYFADSNLETGSAGFINLVMTVYLVLLFLSSTYFVFLQGFGGRTIGKMVLGIRIIREDGESIGLREAFIRWVGYIVSTIFLFIGFIWALFDPKGQTWHDKFAGTYVVRE
jgi:uncharacterized RDD family membrane protein YckC